MQCEIRRVNGSLLLANANFVSINSMTSPKANKDRQPSGAVLLVSDYSFDGYIRDANAKSTSNANNRPPKSNKFRTALNNKLHQRTLHCENQYISPFNQILSTINSSYQAPSLVNSAMARRSAEEPEIRCAL